jgi:hypothetical protein
MSRFGRLAGAAILAGIGVLFASSPAHAQLRMRIEDTGTNVGVVLTGAGGVVQFNNAGGANFSTNFGLVQATGLSKPGQPPGPPAVAEIHLNNITVATTGPATIVLTLEDTGFTAPATGGAFVTGSFGGTINGGTARGQSWVNTANAVPNLGTNAGTTTTTASLAGNPAGGVVIPAGSIPDLPAAFVGGPGAFSTSGSAPFTVSGPYSMFMQVTLTFTSAGTASFDIDQSVFVPEPGTGLAALASLPFVGSLYWLRRRYKKA